METHVCKFCGKIFESGCLLGNHVAKLCDKNPNRGLQKNSKIWTCTICGSTFKTRSLLRSHRKDSHWGTETPEYRSKYCGLHIPINESCKFCGKQFKYKENLTVHERHCVLNENRIPAKGHKQSEESKRKLSGAAIRNLEKGTHNIFTRERKFSHGEEYFNKVFIDAEIQYKVGRYILDYAWIKYKLYVEVDGEQHYTETGIEHDKKRTEYLKNIGWTCIKRIRWAEFQKLTLKEREEFIKEIYCGVPGVVPDLSHKQD